MKVVQINAVYKLSSTGRTVMEMDDFLKSHGIESFKFYSVNIKGSNPYDIIGNHFDHKVHALMSRVFGTLSVWAKNW